MINCHKILIITYFNMLLCYLNMHNSLYNGLFIFLHSIQPISFHTCLNSLISGSKTIYCKLRPSEPEYHTETGLNQNCVGSVASLASEVRKPVANLVSEPCRSGAGAWCCNNTQYPILCTIYIRLEGFITKIGL